MTLFGTTLDLLQVREAPFESLVWDLLQVREVPFESLVWLSFSPLPCRFRDGVVVYSPVPVTAGRQSPKIRNPY